MNLKQGVLTIDGFDITAATEPNTLKQQFPEARFRTSGNLAIAEWREHPASLDGTEFRIVMDFENGRIRYVRMWPVLGDGFSGGPDERTQAEHRRISDAWLRKELGEPDRHTKESTQYLLTWGRASAASSFGGRSPFELGYILLAFD